MCNYIRKEEFPAVEKSKVLSEVSKGRIYIPEIKPSVKELEGNKYICRVDVLIEDNRLLTKEKTSFFNTLFKFSYPAVNKNEEILGYIEICPSFEMLDKLISDKFVISVIFSSIILFLLLMCLIFYIYIKRYIFSPFNQIKAIIENLSGSRKIDFNKIKGPGIWKDLFVNLNRLNNKVFDINTVMKLLFSATNINGSEFELINSVQQIFDIIRKRIPTARSVLLIPENGQLKVIAKRGFFKRDIAFVSGDSKNYVWDCYQNSLDKIINDISEVDKSKLSDLCEDSEMGSFATVALIDESVGTCVGVLVIVTETKDSFTYDAIKILKVVSGYIVSLINKTFYHQKIEEKNVRLEAEGQFATKELFYKNELVMRRMKNINTVFDIFSFVMERTEMNKVSEIKEIIKYIIEKSKENFSVQYSGIFKYNKEKDELSSMLTSFGLEKEITFKNKKDSLYTKILNTKTNMLFNTRAEADLYRKTDFCKYLTIDSAIFLPIKNRKDDVIAFFGLINKTDGEFNAIDIKFSEYIAVIISSILKNKK
ncbi:MAG: hypothetical protein II816_05510 [Elusimicrobia bacterium]|nr:hypothetical protein [Elusimicrobiota bacterium]